MQQASVNHCVTELANGGMAAINGPPGTGKTTLLRDIVAEVVLDRAIAMSKFDKPCQAFSHVTTMKVGQAFAHLYELDASLMGHEIVVASSNNKAVENISREIPAASAIADDLNPPARYFQSIADSVAAGNRPITDRATWGLAAAVLGNATNRSAFIQSFYWHDKRGMAFYLKAVLGATQPAANSAAPAKSDDLGIQDVVTIEQPPRSEIEAIECWRAARQRFLRRLQEAEKLQKRAQACYDAVQRKPIVVQQVNETTRERQSAKRALTSAIEKEAIAKQAHASAIVSERQAADDRMTIDRMRPGFFSCLFTTRRYREWRIQMEMAQVELRKARAQLKATADAQLLASRTVAAATKEVRDREQKQQHAQAELARISSIIDAMRSHMGANLADDDFWAQDPSIVELASPWIHDEWQKTRASLFVEAFSLHRAFIDAAAKPLRHNLRAAIEVLKGRVLNAQQERTRRSLWASLFLVVPVVSTTFASTARLFGPLGREQLGWLLIDEAGQATPQAAVGAIWRARRSIVIGDPLQIQPVVTTPQKLIRSIFGEFKVNAEEWAAPEMSAQTLADRASWFGTGIRTSDGDIWVGSPLRVHRRCEDPMFKISNHVAYDGLMVFGTPPGASAIGDILGKSRWIDNPTDDAIGKWSATEGSEAIVLLRTLLNAGLQDPDVFFITPFRIVAQNLRQIIRNDTSLSQRLPINPWEWTRDRVGTVHTFQGKEADAVIIVLGAPADASAGARHWAGHPPNLLNVAVTRAKRRLYVIGKRDAWKDAGAFSHLVQLLPVEG